MAGGGDAEEAEKFGVKTKVIGVLTILGVIVIQYGTSALDKVIEHRKSLKEIVNMMYRELMVLGIVAFALFVIEATEAVDIAAADRHVFEEVHFLLFLVAVVYGFMIVAILYFSYAIDRTWNHYEALQTVSGQWQEIRENFEALGREIGAPARRDAAGIGAVRQFARFCAHPVGWMNYRRLLEHVRFHELRAHFIRANHMPRNFAFAGYLKKCKQHVLLELVEVRSGAWVLIAWILSLSLFATGIDENFATALDVADIMCILSGLVLAACGLVYVKINRIYWCLLHSEFIHYDPNKPEAFVVSAADRRGHQESLFWFGSPGLLIDLLQFLQFAVSVNVAVVVQAIPSVAAESSGRLAAMVVLLFLALVGFFSLLPIAVPRYTLATHVGEFVDRELLSEALKKQQRNFKSRALPPSLRQAFALAEHEAQGGSDPRARLGVLLDSKLVRAVVQGLVLLYFFAISYQQHWLANTEPDDGNSARRRASWEAEEGWSEVDGSMSGSRKLAGGGADGGGSGGDWSDDCSTASPDGRCYNHSLLVDQAVLASVLALEALLGTVARGEDGGQLRSLCDLDVLATIASAAFMYAATHLLTKGGDSGDVVGIVHALAGVILLRVVRLSGLHHSLPSMGKTMAGIGAVVSRPRGAAAGRPTVPYMPRQSALALDRPLYVDTTPATTPSLGLKGLPKPPRVPATELVPLTARQDSEGEEKDAIAVTAPKASPPAADQPTPEWGGRARTSEERRPGGVLGSPSPLVHGLARLRSAASMLGRERTPSPPPAPSPGLDLNDLRRSIRDHSMRNEHGKHLLAMQLWQDVLKQHPAITAAEGKFSVPVLRLMLGLTAYDETKTTKPALSRTSSRSGTLSNASSYSSASEANSSGYAEESDNESGDEADTPLLDNRDARKRYDAERAERMLRTSTTYDGSDKDSDAASPPLRRRRRRRNRSTEDEDREAPILPQPPASFLARVGSRIGFLAEAPGSPAGTPGNSTGDVASLGLEPALHRRAASVESRMFEQMLEQTGVKMTAQEAEEAWAEDRWLSTVLRRGNAFKRAPPELPHWRETHVFLTRKEVAFANRDQTVDIEGGVLYPNHDLRKRVSLNTITGLDMADHQTILKIRTPHMTVQFRGMDQADTLGWFEQIHNAKEEGARL